MARRSLLLSWLLCSLLLEAVLATADHPAPSPCNGDHGLGSESCTTSGRQSLLQVTRSSVKAMPEASVFDNGDAIVDEALADLESNSVPGMLSELKDTVSASEFFTENEGTEGKKSSDNPDLRRQEEQEELQRQEELRGQEGTEGKKSFDNPDALQDPAGTERWNDITPEEEQEELRRQSAGDAEQPREAPYQQPREAPYQQPREAPYQQSGNAAKVPGCTPTCKWSCSSPACEQECEPLCKPGKCETRCATMDLAGCLLGCEQPECATVCPKNHCAKDGCPKCSTHCSQPLCKLRCPQKQNCTSVCESPHCEWRCRKPERCPRPKCKLECDQAKECLNSSVYKKLPQLRKGEIKVASFVPPSSLLQMSHGQLTTAENSDQQRKALHLGATVEAMDSETSEVTRFVIELPLASES